MNIHPSAIIDNSAQLADSVEIGAYAIVGPNCTLGQGVKLDPHAIVKEYTRVGNDVHISSGAVLGGAPQDVGFKGERSWVEIGDRTLIRECVTVNRASGEDQVTRVGANCMLMAYSHVGHNTQVGQEAILANAVQLGGHVEIGDFAFLGGSSVFHQFVRVGTLSIVGGFSATRQDVAPYSMSDGRPVELIGINKIGLRRRGYDLANRTILKRAFHLLFFSPLNSRQALAEIEDQWGDKPYIQELINFVNGSKRGISKAVKGSHTRKPLSESTESEENIESLV
jgi:UDP-N-acetylglucosamine acyltransferase